MPHRRQLLAAILLAALAGCGQKGPLYLPESAPQAEKPAEQRPTEQTPQQPSN